MSAIGTRVTKLEDRLGGLDPNEARIRALSDEELEREIAELDVLLHNDLEARGLDVSGWDRWERMAVLTECERLQVAGLPFVLADINLAQLTADFRRSMAGAHC